MSIRRFIVDRIIEYLTQPLPRYERRSHNDLRALKAHIRKADVILVEGDQRVSAIIRYLTQSSWSHSVLYVGDELVRASGNLAESVRTRFGDESEHMVVEALPQGVIAAPLAKYVDYNIRLCRPHGLRDVDRAVVMGEALRSIGWTYDLRNVLDLTRYLIPVSLVPARWRDTALHFGSGEPTEVICSSLIARLFHQVGFPVRPTVTYPEGSLEAGDQAPQKPWLRSIFGQPSVDYTGLFRIRHPALMTPSDFDLSPYFDIVKFNLLAGGEFDYHKIQWADEPADGQTQGGAGSGTGPPGRASDELPAKASS